MQIQYRDGFEDIIYDLEAIATYHRCPYIDPLATNSRTVDPAQTCFAALRGAVQESLWAAQANAELTGGLFLESADEFKDRLRKALSFVRLEDLLQSKTLFDQINNLPDNSMPLYNFLKKRIEANVKVDAIGFGPLETNIGSKYHIHIVADFMYTASTSMANKRELLILGNPFYDSYIYDIFSPTYFRAFMGMDVEPDNIYVSQFTKPAVKYSPRHTEDKLQLARMILDSMYNEYVNGLYPIGDYFDPSKMRVCKNCVFQGLCRTTDRLDLINLVKKTRLPQKSIVDLFKD